MFIDVHSVMTLSLGIELDYMPSGKLRIIFSTTQNCFKIGIFTSDYNFVSDIYSTNQSEE